MTEKTTTLRERYGYERAMFVAAWVSLVLHERSKKGLVSGGPAIERPGCLAVVKSGLAAGYEPPSDDEIEHALRAIMSVDPSLSVTQRGFAFADYAQMTKGAGHG